MKLLKNFSKTILPILLPLFLLTACGDNEVNKTVVTEADIEEPTVAERDGMLEDIASTANYTDAVMNPRNPMWYSYTYSSQTETNAADMAERNTMTKPQAIKDREVKKLNVNSKVDLPEVPDVKTNPMKVVYTISETDRLPLFTSACVNAKDPEECSNEAVADFVKDNIEFPKSAIRKGHDGMEYVTFTIDENGEVSDRLKLRSKDKPCADCGKAAMAVVSQMDKWQPAMKNGQPVAVEITLPIRFETVGGSISLR